MTAIADEIVNEIVFVGKLREAGEETQIQNRKPIEKLALVALAKLALAANVGADDVADNPSQQMEG